MHGIGGVAGMHDNFAGLDLEALAAADQFFGIISAVEDPGEPVAQIGLFLSCVLMLRDDLVLAPLQRMVEFAGSL